MRGDLGQLEQVLVSLAVSARDAMPQGGRLEISGLGLANVYGIVERFGGQIDLVTAPGMWSTFVLHFPATGHPLSPLETPRPPRARSGLGTTVLLDADHSTATIG